jgi:RNA polymerase sigma-70 factor (ECF subfamily)
MMHSSPFDLNNALRLTAGGDRAALRRIYDAEASRMLGVAMRLLRRRALAEEAVHDTFVQVWQKAASFDPARGEGRTWLYAILRNRALNILRGEARTDLMDDFESMGLEAPGEDAEALGSGSPTQAPYADAWNAWSRSAARRSFSPMWRV